MQTNLADFIKGSADGERAASILGACVHCGFCSATCPTYQLLGDERDSPRGRIYLIKQVLEGQVATERTQLHLDRCLTCRNCETTCPSGVQYGQLLDIGRKVVDSQVARGWRQRLVRELLCQVLPRRKVVLPLLKLGQWVRPVLPRSLQLKLAKPRAAGVLPAWAKRAPTAPSAPTTPLARLAPSTRSTIAGGAGSGTTPAASVRQMILHEGCVQPGMAPNINAAAIRVFDAVGVQLLRVGQAGCCGALRWHLDRQQAALDDARRNIDAWWPWIDAADPIEAIVSTASGCGVMLKDYGELLAHDPAYAAKAQRVAQLVRDVSEVLLPLADQLAQKVRPGASCVSGVSGAAMALAYHPPCTLQHGQRLKGQVETLLRALGAEVHLPRDAHLCCGSAGAWSVLQPELATTLRDNKLAALHACGSANMASAAAAITATAAPPAALPIVSGNIGCLAHLQSGTTTEVRHWIEWIDDLLSRP